MTPPTPDSGPSPMPEQFDFRPPAVHRNDPETSVIAAGRVDAKAHRLRILRWLYRVGDHGGTAYEAWQATGGARPHVAGTRLLELSDPLKGAPLVRKTSERRPTDTGSPAIVWVLTPAGEQFVRAMRTEAAA